MQTDTLVHLAGWLLTVLGAIYTAYPVLPGRLRGPLTWALVAGLAGGLALAAALALVVPPLVGLLWLTSGAAATPVLSKAVLAIAAYSLVAGTLVEPLPITGRRQALLPAGRRPAIDVPAAVAGHEVGAGRRRHRPPGCFARGRLAGGTGGERIARRTHVRAEPSTRC